MSVFPSVLLFVRFGRTLGYRRNLAGGNGKRPRHGQAASRPSALRKAPAHVVESRSGHWRQAGNRGVGFLYCRLGRLDPG